MGKKKHPRIPRKKEENCKKERGKEKERFKEDKRNDTWGGENRKEEKSNLHIAAMKTKQYLKIIQKAKVKKTKEMQRILKQD